MQKSLLKVKVELERKKDEVEDEVEIRLAKATPLAGETETRPTFFVNGKCHKPIETSVNGLGQYVVSAYATHLLIHALPKQTTQVPTPASPVAGESTRDPRSLELSQCRNARLLTVQVILSISSPFLS